MTKILSKSICIPTFWYVGLVDAPCVVILHLWRLEIELHEILADGSSTAVIGLFKVKPTKDMPRPGAAKKAKKRAKRNAKS